MQVLFNEIRVFASRLSGWRSVLPHLALLAAFGFMTPSLKGIDFLDTQVLGAYACLGILFAGPATAQAFPAGAPSTFGQAKARIFVAVLYGEIVSMVLLFAGVATVFARNRGSYVPEPDWETLSRCALFGLAASGMLASLAALVTVRFSRPAAIWCLRLTFFGLLLLYFYRGQRLADVGITAAIACLVVAGLFIEILRRSYR
jgi:hypothetical protein